MTDRTLSLNGSTTGNAHPPPTPGDVVARLRRTATTRRTHGIEWRKSRLRALRRLLHENEDVMAQALAADGNRSPGEVLLAENLLVRPELTLAERNVARWAKPKKVRLPLSVGFGSAEVRPTPYGIAMVIAPWNYPFQTVFVPLIHALAAGNCVVIKPSEVTPASSQAIAELIARYFDPDEVAVVEGGPAETQAVIDAGVDMIFFTGSTPVGRAIMEAASHRLTPVVLELGGKSPVIVARDADLEVAARRIAFTKIVNSGQTCVAADYVLVERAVYEPFVSALHTEMTAMWGNSPELTSIINDRHVDRLSRLLDTHGGTCALGGGIDRGMRRIEPTMILEPDLDSPIMREEIFGPIIPVVPVDSVDAAIEFVSARPSPLAVYVFTESSETIERVAAGTRSGATVANHLAVQVLVSQAAFGGVGESGMGRHRGKAGFDAFSNPRSHVVMRSRPDPKLLYPPYGALKQRLMRLALR